MSHAITCEGKPDVFMTVTYRVGPESFRWEGGEVKFDSFSTLNQSDCMGKRLLSQGIYTENGNCLREFTFPDPKTNLTENETLPRTSPAHLMPGAPAPTRRHSSVPV